MKNVINISVTVFGLLLSSTQAQARIACNTNCDKKALIKVPCPTLGNPGRKCKVTNHVKRAACLLEKKISCKKNKKKFASIMFSRVRGPVKAALTYGYDQWKSDFERDMDDFNKHLIWKEMHERCPQDCIEAPEADRNRRAQEEGDRVLKNIKYDIEKGSYQEEFNDFCDKEYGYSYGLE